MLPPCVALVLLALTAPAAAQRVDVTAQAIFALTHADPIPGGGTLTELRITQPWIMVRGSTGAAWLQVTLDGEGATLANGELALGAFGEGYVDRRHPHTYFHELMAGASVPHFTVAGGKGFVPFGTDDPMTRPPLRYPINHHFAQILERAVLLASLAFGPVEIEASVFNGDEPENPSQWPNWERFGDSRALRATVRPRPELELQASYAFVASPEHRPGAGSDQDKFSVSARWDGRGHGGGWYGLAEYAYSVDKIGDFDYHSVLAEGERTLGATRLYGRLERTDRPEEVRTANLFRTQRPHTDNSLIGTTRWTMATAGAARRFRLGWGELSVEPALELWFGTVEELTGAVFDPESFYGTTSLWSITLGAKLAWGTPGHRMGRYGVLPAGHSTPSH